MNKTGKVDDKLLLKSIWEGYRKARSLVRKPKFANEKRGQGNRLLSAKFVWEVSHNIHQDIFSKKYGLNVIEVDDQGKKKSGEWLVDACITEGRKRKEFISKIVFAMESESGTDKQAFNEDFAKLVHVKAPYKLYLNGLDRKNLERTNDYIERRLKYAEQCLNDAEQFLNEENADTFYLGFWPSPGKLDGKSAWKQLKKYKHLDKIHLYKFTQGSFQQVQ